MNICVLGASHKTAPIDIREKLFLTPLQQELFLSEVRLDAEIAEAFVLSTCNRTEIYAVTVNHFDIQKLLVSLCRIKKIQPSDYCRYFYSWTGSKAVRHLFELSTGLDSLVIGERQILGQLKAAVDLAREKNTLSQTFNVLTNYAIRTGKKAQTETQIGYGGSSVSWAAVTKAEESLGSLKDKDVLVIGAGEMGKLSVEQIASRGFRKMFLMNRTHCMAQGLATEFGGEAVPFSDIKDMLQQVDLCLCASGAPHYIIEKETVKTCMSQRTGRKMIFMDISMPRNIDPAVADVAEVELYGIDDLTAVVDRTLGIRQEAMADVHRIIDQKIAEFYHQMEKREEILS